MEKIKQKLKRIKVFFKRIAKAWRVLLNRQMCETCKECSCNT
jgi:hypothetical protein